MEIDNNYLEQAKVDKRAKLLSIYKKEYYKADTWIDIQAIIKSIELEIEALTTLDEVEAYTISQKNQEALNTIPRRVPFLKWIFLSLVDGLKKLGLVVLDFIWSIIKAFGNIFYSLYKALAFIGKKIAAGFKWLFQSIKNKKSYSIISLFVMGSGTFLTGQIVKGIIFFILQIVFVIFMIFVGAPSLAKFVTLGQITSDPGGWNEDLGIYEDPVIGDNSVKILLFGVAVILLIIGFLFIYYLNVKTAHDNEEKYRKVGLPLNFSRFYKELKILDDTPYSKKEAKVIYQDLKKKNARDLPKNFTSELKSLGNEKFHLSVLGFPTISAFVFTILPLIFMILIAFTNFDRDHQPPGKLFDWTGFDNFINMFAGKGEFAQLSRSLWSILGWSLEWAVYATVLNYIFGMILALMINKKGIKLKKFWRTIFVMTIAIPQFVTLLSVRSILDDAGPIVHLIGQIFKQDIKFFSIANARTTVIIVNLWVGVPYTMLITSGILMNIPADLYESATIDGAGPLTKFFKITLPYMLFVTGPYLVTAFIGNINNFNVIYFLTGGGPDMLSLYQAGKTDLLVTWLYKLTADRSDFKTASTIGIVIFMISSFISLVMFSKTASVQKEEEFQ